MLNNNIKVYEELSYIHTYDGEIYPTPLTTMELEKFLNGNIKFLNLGTDLIAVSSISKVESKKADDVDNAIIQIKDKELRKLVDAEVSKRRAEGKKMNTTILSNIINRLGSMKS